MQTQPVLIGSIDLVSRQFPLANIVHPVDAVMVIDWFLENRPESFPFQVFRIVGYTGEKRPSGWAWEKTKSGKKQLIFILGKIEKVGYQTKVGQVKDYSDESRKTKQNRK